MAFALQISKRYRLKHQRTGRSFAVHINHFIDTNYYEMNKHIEQLVGITGHSDCCRPAYLCQPNFIDTIFHMLGENIL